MYDREAPIRFPVELGGLGTGVPAAIRYPRATAATNVQFNKYGGFFKRKGNEPYSQSANLTGTITVTAGSAAVVGVSTVFTTEYAVDDWIIIGTTGECYVVGVITDNTHITLTSNVTTAAAASTHKGSKPLADVSSLKEAITGIFQFNKRDTTTRYTIVCTPTQIVSFPSNGTAPTVLASSIAGLTATDFWDATAFNDELILTNGVTVPYITDGTAANTGTLTGRVWRTKTSGPLAISEASQMIEAGGLLYSPGGASATVAYEKFNLFYNPVFDAWGYAEPENTKRFVGSGTKTFENLQYSAGISAVATAAPSEEFSPGLNKWKAITNYPLLLRHTHAFSINNSGYIAGGEESDATESSVNYKYDSPTDSWAVATALSATRTRGQDASMDEMGVIAGGVVSATVVATGVKYDPFTDAWAALANNLADERYVGAGTGGTKDRTSFVIGGADDVPTEKTTCYSYNDSTTNWTTETAIPVAGVYAQACSYDYSVYYFGGRTIAGTRSSALYQLCISPSAATAHYCLSYGGYVLLANSTTYPSGLFYSAVGNARTHGPFQMILIKPDDGDWITGLFSYQGKVYVSKVGKMFYLPFTVLDPDLTIGDQEVIELANIPGAVSGRSIVVTDYGVFYLAKDGFRMFDGAQSILISDDIASTLEGYVDSRNKYACGVWNRENNEIWWSMTATSTTHNAIVVYNLDTQGWSVFSGVNAETIAAVEDANDIDQVLYGTASTTDGNLWKMNSTEADRGFAISANYQTGWASPAGADTVFDGHRLNIWTERSGAWNLTVNIYKDMSATASTTETINLLSGSYPDDHFANATIEKAKMTAGVDDVGHQWSIAFSNTSADQPFKVYGAELIGKKGQVGDTPE